MKKIKTEYYRKLPHLQPVGAIFFITFCLKDAIPGAVIQRLQEERDLKIKEIRKEKEANNAEAIYLQQKKYFATYDAFLDKESPRQFLLRKPEVAKIISDKIRTLDGSVYTLIAYCIMPTHVHLAIDTTLQTEKSDNFSEVAYQPLSFILQQIKGGSAYEINKVLGTSGRVWQVESYDHYVRSQKELQNILTYILQNPVKAGLVKTWEEWPYSYVHENYA